MSAPATTRRELALHGGAPVRSTPLPYGRQSIDEEDVQAVIGVLRSDFLTTGPQVDAFECDVAGYTGAEHAVAVNSGTAALHTALASLKPGPGDEVIVPAITFAASANAALYVGATPVIVDVDPHSLLIDPEAVKGALTERTKAVVAVDYAGQPADVDALREVLKGHGAALVADACHSLGASLRGRSVGTLADLTCLSFHPVKAMTTGEGGMVLTDDATRAEAMRRFRNHGIDRDAAARQRAASHYYEMVELGWNYRLTDLQCALGRSQLVKLDRWIARRREIAQQYDEAFATLPEVRPLTMHADRSSAWHLYVIRLEPARLSADRDEVFRALRAENIGVNVHYMPVHLHPWYRDNLGTRPGQCPEAEGAWERMLTLPLFPEMTDEDAADVVAAVKKVIGAFRL